MPSRKPVINLRRDPTVRKGPIRDSKRVKDRDKSAASLCAAIEVLKADLAAAFAARYAAELRDGETPPDQTLALELAGRAVEAAIEELIAAEDDYCATGVRRKELEGACRWVARGEVYPEVVDVRRQLVRILGTAKAAKFHGIAGKTRRKPGRLYPQLRLLVRRLEDEEHKLTPARGRGTPEHRRAMLAQVRPGYRKLTKMLRKLERLEGEEDYLRKVRDIALEDYDAVYDESFAFVRGVCRAAGYDKELAWRLRAKVDRRRLRRKARGEREARAEGRRPPRDRSGPPTDPVPADRPPTVA